MRHNQQLTYYNNQKIKDYLNIVLDEISTIFEDSFEKDKTAALILIGGYGRGEGGIMMKNGQYHPHNNLDILYIHNGSVDSKVVEAVDKALQALAKTYDIGIDMSAINKQKLLKLDGLVIGYDMRFGHKTLLGDSTFLKNHEAFSLSNIDPIDIRQLLVNRGTLLLINRVLLKKHSLSEDEKKLIIKHAIKSIIGYGDALLFFHNAYHWSYAQKQSNMSELSDIDEAIKKLYADALLFRFKPNYELYLQKDLNEWNDELIVILSSIHLQCEKINLSQSNLDWRSYFNIALENGSYPRQKVMQKAKSFLHGLNNIPVLKELKSVTDMKNYMQFGAKGMLSLLFPYIAYKIYPQQYCGLFKTSLQLQRSDEQEYLKRFLMLWSQHGDTNFKNVLNSYNIKLENL
jgi:hypothetical protein